MVQKLQKVLISEHNEAFGSFDEFKAAFAQAAATRFGSGWAWLVLSNGKLEVVSHQTKIALYQKVKLHY